MNELLAFVGANLAACLIIIIVGIYFKWLFIRSAVKSGTIAAMEEILNKYDFLEEIEYDSEEIIKNANYKNNE